MATENIPSRLHCVAEGNVLTGANEILDDDKGKKQSVINQENDQRLETLETAVGTGGSVDSRIESAKTEIVGGASSDCNTLGKAEALISTNANDIAALQEAYAALTQNDVVVVAPADTWPVATPAQNTIYRVVDRTNTPPQYYTDYMWNGTVFVEMARYNNAIDSRPKKDSQNLVTSGGVFDNMGALDVSELNATENPHTLAKYVDLSAALAAVPTDYQKGGMSIKFVQSSDNKYVQYRLMSDTFNTTETNWQGADDVPTAGSDNLVKSGGVAGYVTVSQNSQTGETIIGIGGTSVDVANSDSTPKIENSNADFAIADENKKAIVVFEEGEIKTKNFDSRNLKSKDTNDTDIDFAVSDDNNNLIVQFSDGELKTKNFDSRDLKVKETKKTNIDYAISDSNDNLIVEFANGHLKTKNFDSSRIGKHFGTFSIIGDSYSTFKGYSKPATNTQWYPTNDSSCQGYNTGNDVTEIEETWFYLFANEYKSALIQNDSYSGSTICYDGYVPGHDSGAAEISFCKRIERLTSPCELLFIFGGTNDSWAQSSIGDYKYSNWTEDDKAYFRPALAYLIDYIKKHHIGTQIVFILNNGLSSDINSSVETICEHYDMPLLKLSSITKVDSHPNTQGMIEINEQLQNFIKTI